MQVKKKITISTVLFFFLLVHSNAQEHIPNSKGFHGFIRPAYGLLNFRNNQVSQFMTYQLSQQEINSIYSAPSSQNTGILTLPMEIGYTIIPYKTHIFIGNQIEDLIRFDITQQIGVKQSIGKLGILQFGMLYTGLTTKVWEDPFITGADRVQTRRSAFGVLLAWEQIGSSGFSMQYSYRDVVVDKESSGIGLYLSSEELNLLRRDGDMHSLNIRYRFYFKQKHRLVPMFEVVRDKRLGGARSRTTYDLSMNYIAKLKNKHQFIANTRLGQASYDKANPIYDIKQKDKRYGFSGSFYLANPWGGKAFWFIFSGAYNYVNANIEFYQQQGVLLQTGVLTRW